MITERDLQEAIAECEGQKNPNANTCIKLAAFYTIKQHMFGESSDNSYSYALAPQTKSFDNTIEYSGDTEFAGAIQGMDVNDFVSLMDELMTALNVVNPRLYSGVMRKLNGLYDTH